MAGRCGYAARIKSRPPAELVAMHQFVTVSRLDPAAGTRAAVPRTAMSKNPPAANAAGVRPAAKTGGRTDWPTIRVKAEEIAGHVAKLKPGDFVKLNWG